MRIAGVLFLLVAAVLLIAVQGPRPQPPAPSYLPSPRGE